MVGATGQLVDHLTVLPLGVLCMALLVAAGGTVGSADSSAAGGEGLGQALLAIQKSCNKLDVVGTFDLSLHDLIVMVDL